LPLSAATPDVRTPNPLVVELLQFGVPASQATVLVPLVMSRNGQVLGSGVAGVVNELELQFA
jgi:hypothetical protein